MIISLAGNDLTKTDHILYNESFANLILYAKSMAHFDDVETKPETKQSTKDPILPKNGSVTTDIQGFFSLMKQLKENE